MANKMTSDEDAFRLGGKSEVDRRNFLDEEKISSILRQEVATMQALLYKAYGRISELVEENQELRKKQ
tara:strand:- start:2731 stop:2934 length:204 start_codon:yes stop_codon:yes gene_type:complete